MRRRSIMMSISPICLAPLRSPLLKHREARCGISIADLKNIPIFALRGEFSDILSARTLAEMGKCNAHFQALEVPKRGHAPLLDEPGVMPAIRKFLEGV